MKSDWKSADGYEPIVSSTSEQETENLKGIQKFQFVLSQFPNNLALRKIAQKRELEMLDLTPEELKQVEEAEEQLQTQMQAQQQIQPNQGQAPQSNLIDQTLQTQNQLSQAFLPQ